MGLRELKKERTRQAIADTAWRLFAARGFDRVTVVDVAREAQVAPATVFNYFPTKEDLFFSRLESFGAGLVEAIEARPEGEPALAAFRRSILEAGGLLELVEGGDAQALEQLRTVQWMIDASPSLQAREQRALSDYADALAELLVAEADAVDEVHARVAARALVMGVQRTLIDYVRRRVLEDDRPEALAADVRDLADRALALLEDGLRDYAPKPHA
jgi:AcrR family transcriptional regulator